MENQNATATQGGEKQISVKAVLVMLEDGKDRKEIKAALGLSHAELQLLFQHPKLKGKKTNRVAKNLTIVDDTEDEGTTASASTASTTQAPPANPIAEDKVAEEEVTSEEVTDDEDEFKGFN